jgi:hypothetical protein
MHEREKSGGALQIAKMKEPAFAAGSPVENDLLQRA